MTERRYGEPVTSGGRVAAVEPDSAADAAGIRAGDRVISVDGSPVRDVLDWQWLTDEDEFDVAVEHDGTVFDLTVTPLVGEPIGVAFEDVVFDGLRECVNACAFCFVNQLPAGLRPSLYVRDDDYRLSFLYGNFITLTNLDDADMERIVSERLSPLYVSLHAVDPDVRRLLVACTVDDTTTERMQVLLDGGIDLHVQIVAVPGVNDGDVLRETLEWLARHEGVESVGVVPLGFTSHQRRYDRSFTAEQAAALIETLAPFQERMKALRDVSWVYAADEFYLCSGVEIPPAESYDDFPQYENGIGMVRSFLDDLREAAPTSSAAATLVTGTLFAPVLERALAQSGLGTLRVLPVVNALMGGNVSVAGLLAGDDIVRAIRADGAGGTYLVPDVVVNSDGLLLDDVPAAELSARSGADVIFVGAGASDLAEAVTRL